MVRLLLSYAAFAYLEILMQPYPRERYYRLDRYSEHSFQGYKNYFNYRLAFLQNIIEHACALLKRQFQILYAMSQYHPARQDMIVTACCIMHNMIKTVTPNDKLIQDVLNHWSSMQNMDADADAGESSHVVDMSNESAQAIGAIKDAIALLM